MCQNKPFRQRHMCVEILLSQADTLTVASVKRLTAQVNLTRIHVVHPFNRINSTLALQSAYLTLSLLTFFKERYTDKTYADFRKNNPFFLNRL